MKPERFFDDPKVRQLAVAAGKGDTATVKRLAAEGVDPNTIGNEGMSPLWWAFGAHNIQGVKALLEVGADPNYIPPGMGGSLLEIALIGDKPFTLPMARVLLEGGADIERKASRGRPMIIRALNGSQRLEKVQAVAAHGGDINATDRCGHSLLQAALAVRAHDVAKWLIEQGADAHHVDKNGGTAAWRIHDALTRNLYADWARESALQLKAMLEARGVKFPPDPPYGWRENPPAGWTPCH